MLTFWTFTAKPLLVTLVVSMLLPPQSNATLLDLIVMQLSFPWMNVSLKYVSARGGYRHARGHLRVAQVGHHEDRAGRPVGVGVVAAHSGHEVYLRPGDVQDRIDVHSAVVQGPDLIEVVAYGRSSHVKPIAVHGGVYIEQVVGLGVVDRHAVASLRKRAVGDVVGVGVLYEDPALRRP